MRINGANSGVYNVFNTNTDQVTNTTCDVRYFNAGDTLGVQVSQNSGGALKLNGSADDSYIVVQRLSGPSVIAANELVCASYGLTSSQAVALNAVLKYDTKVVDTHSAYSTVTGLFTAPVSGTYEILSSFNMTASGGTYIKKNSTAVAYIGTAGANTYISGSYVLNLVAGDTIGLFADVSSTYAAITGNGFNNKFSITRLGF